jgi:hypothetical protein
MATKVRGVRIPDELWAEVQRTAAGSGESVSDVVRRFLIDYIGGNLPGYTSGFVAGVHTGRQEERETLKNTGLGLLLANRGQVD